uniref:Prolyl endopeptidase n=1 Tax=Octactis speculum TaxID=3111310 RepID=A0A7S2C6C3_9STRA
MTKHDNAIGGGGGGGDIDNHFQRSLETYRVYATAGDGAEVPMTLVHRRGLSRNGDNPVLVTSYGAYGTNLDLSFDPTLAPYLLGDGWVLCFAHLRGGGEGGRAWYDAGRQCSKRTSVTDLVSCVDHLVKEGYTRPAKLALASESAGGLLAAAAVNERGQSLAQACILRVPFIDLIGKMQDPNLALTVHEYDEWGDPADAATLRYMQSYAPLLNIRAQRYPWMLVTAQLADTRVGLWDPVEWVLKTRAANTSAESKILLQIGDGGHSDCPQGDPVQRAAMECAFLYKALGLPAPTHEGPLLR